MAPTISLNRGEINKAEIAAARTRSEKAGAARPFRFLDFVIMVWPHETLGWINDIADRLTLINVMAGDLHGNDRRRVRARAIRLWTWYETCRDGRVKMDAEAAQ